MMVIFVSQCEKKALARTRRVLDTFADRIGDSTWRTVITQEGLLAVKKLLRKSASKNTAVSCHWLRSRAQSELLWIVGKRESFDSDGRVPVNHQRRSIAVSSAESDWHTLPLIQALAVVAALLHDWGKATRLFQNKLDPSSGESIQADPIRHEWLSCLLLRALVELSGDWQSDHAWLMCLTEQTWDERALQCLLDSDIRHHQRPLSELPPLAMCVAWLIVSHHKLPLSNEPQKWRGERMRDMSCLMDKITSEWGYENPSQVSRLAECFHFPHGLMSESGPWQKQLRKWAKRLLVCRERVIELIENGGHRVVLHHARLCLMLADHHVSSHDPDPSWLSPSVLYANTFRDTRAPKQKLDEHLVRVARQAARNAWLLPTFESAAPVASDISSLKKRSPREYAWQDKVVSAIKAWRKEVEPKRCGVFVVNMASTGAGKTFANAKIMRALSADGQSLRYSLALGLRTLTLQTGDEYRHRVGLDSSELAVLIGSQAISQLHQTKRQTGEDSSAEALAWHQCSGSESEETLLDGLVDFDGSLPEEGLSTVLKRDKDRQILYAPVLACTIDHLMAATETRRGGRYILPALRLMSSDLVIDEVDDFTGSDLVAIGRVIHLAGMLGRKVMISSATISPDIAEGYHRAYREGWQLFAQTRSATRSTVGIWCDEFTAQIHTLADEKSYRHEHLRFVAKRVKKLHQQPIKRRAYIASCQSVLQATRDTQQQHYFSVMAQAAVNCHQLHHQLDQTSGVRVSFGLVRMANINPCVAFTRWLLAQTGLAPGVQVRAMAYHSRQVLLLRHLQEQHLDQVLKRKEAEDASNPALTHPDIRQHLDALPAETQDVLFVLVATPVEEVGRDHDFDWAVVEPSSYRSMIQLAGRVRRHRKGAVSAPNIALLDYNWRGIQAAARAPQKQGEIVFTKPGFESERWIANSYCLSDLIEQASLDGGLEASPRILPPNEQQPPSAPSPVRKKICLRSTTHRKAKASPTAKRFTSLVNLEHQATKALLNTAHDSVWGPGTLNGYLFEAWWLSAEPQSLNPFRKSEEGKQEKRLCWLYDEQLQQSVFCEKDAQGRWVARERDLNIQTLALSSDERKRLWLARDYELALEGLSQHRDKPLRYVSACFGQLSFPWREHQVYCYNDQFGLFREI